MGQNFFKLSFFLDIFLAASAVTFRFRQMLRPFDEFQRVWRPHPKVRWCSWQHQPTQHVHKPASEG